MAEAVRLTQTVAAAGCAAKLDPGLLSELLNNADIPVNDRLLVGIEKLDDAGVYRLTDDLAVVQTLDFFTPIVDDPYLFGAIAAANALSDVYAMGGTPVTAMNIVCFPTAKMDKSILAAIIRGGLSKIRESGAVLAGGHSIMDTEVKYGLSVTGIVHPGKIWKNCTARPGDCLILTKALGTGIMSTAIKQGRVTEAQAREATDSMSALNRTAAEVFHRHTVHACTDVTGFSLMGHGLEMAEGSGVTLRLHSAAVPLMDRVPEFAAEGVLPGGAQRNRRYYEPRVFYRGTLQIQSEILFDPQTSGGLLCSVPEKDAEACLRQLQAAGCAKAAIVGEVVERGSGASLVVD
jgi:selenide,water dikinase